MKNITIKIWTIVVAVICGFVLYYVLSAKQVPIITQNSNTPSIIVQSTSTGATASSGTNNSIKSYLISEVSKHNNQTSCWTVVNNKIYDITSFVSTHPAGVNKILRGCGIDATTMFNRVGAHDISKLSNVFIGNLKI